MIKTKENISLIKFLDKYCYIPILNYLDLTPIKLKAAYQPLKLAVT